MILSFLYRRHQIFEDGSVVLFNTTAALSGLLLDSISAIMSNLRFWLSCVHWDYEVKSLVHNELIECIVFSKSWTTSIQPA